MQQLARINKCRSLSSAFKPVSVSRLQRLLTPSPLHAALYHHWASMSHTWIMNICHYLQHNTDPYIDQTNSVGFDLIAWSGNLRFSWANLRNAGLSSSKNVVVDAKKSKQRTNGLEMLCPTAGWRVQRSLYDISRDWAQHAWQVRRKTIV